MFALLLLSLAGQATGAEQLTDVGQPIVCEYDRQTGTLATIITPTQPNTTTYAWLTYSPDSSQLVAIKVEDQRWGNGTEGLLWSRQSQSVRPLGPLAAPTWTAAGDAVLASRSIVEPELMLTPVVAGAERINLRRPSGRPILSPDGAFLLTHEYVNGEGNDDVTLRRVDRIEEPISLRLPPNLARELWFAFSPQQALDDGREVVCTLITTDGGGQDRSKILAADLVTSDGRVAEDTTEFEAIARLLVSESEETTQVYPPTAALQTDDVVFSAKRPDGTYTIRHVRQSTPDDVTELFRATGKEVLSFPTLSPDGHYLAFVVGWIGPKPEALEPFDPQALRTDAAKNVPRESRK